MIVIAGTVPTKADRRDDVIAAATAMVRATLEEAGCNAYSFSFSMTEPATVCIFEEWVDQAALDAHFATAHMAEFRGKLGDLVAGAGTFTKYEIASSGPLF